MAGQFSRRPVQRPPVQEVSPALFQHRRFWLKLAAYRPLLILVGIWVVLLSIAVTAYEHLLYTKTGPLKPDSAEEIAVYPHQRIAGDRSPTAIPSENAPEFSTPADQSPGSETTGNNAEPASSENPQSLPAGISPWSLGALVVICALGCSMLSRQLQAPRVARRKPKKRLLDKPVPVADSSPVKDGMGKGTPVSPERLAPYNASQSGVASTPNGDVSLSNSPVPKPAAQGNAAKVTVVPQDAQHPLDWPEDSLVNTADVRRRRSLSSFL